MYQGYNKAFWGIFFITFHINLGPIQILPPFIGYLVILSGINILYEETQIDLFRKGQILAIILTIRSLIFGIVELLSIDILNSLISSTVIITVFSALEMIMFYKIIQGSTEYFYSRDFEEAVERNIGTGRFYTISSIIGIISMNLALVFNIKILSGLAAFLLIVLRIYLMIWARRNRNIFAIE